MVLAVSVLPARSWAQAAGGGGGAGGGLAGLQQIRQVMGQLDLTDDQKTKIRGIVQDAIQSGRDTMQGIADATPEERQAKMQDLQKLVTETKQKVQDELTPDQKAKYFPLTAKMEFKQMTDLLTALKTAAAKAELTDDQKKQLNHVFDDSQKTLDGYKADADAVTDAASADDFSRKIEKFQLDLRTQIVAAIGQKDTQTLMQSARQAMRGNIGGRAARPARNEAAPTTAPAAK
jgi:Spy/CpxP family protein refolding chaperone